MMKKVGTEYDRLFSHAIEILRSRGELKPVEDYVSMIEDRDYRDVTLAKLGVFLAANNRGDEGMQLAHGIEQPMERADALLGIAREYAKAGHGIKAKAALLEAISAAEAIERSTWEAPSILLQASTEFYHLDFRSDASSLLQRAIQMAQKGADFDSAKVIGGAAVLLAKWGYAEEATSVAEAIAQPELREATLNRLKEILA